MKEQRQKAVLAGLLVVWVLVALWAWSRFQAPPPMLAGEPAETTEIAYFLEEGGTPELRLDWLDGREAVPVPARDLFSAAPIVAATARGATPPAESAAAPAPLPPAPIAAALRYMGYVETSAGTLALLRDGSQMYLAGEGSRVGPGYRVAIVNAAFVEIEYRGERRRLPVSGQEGATNGPSGPSR
jgi:hypothetical protein